MAEARVTQHGIEVELSIQPEIRATQHGIEVEIGPVGLYVTEFGIEIELAPPEITGPVLCGVDMPAGLANRGRYTPPTPDILGHSGAGVPILSRYQRAAYHWDFVTDEEWIYLTVDVLGGGRSIRCQGDTKLYDRDMNLITWANITIQRPTSRIRLGQHTDVTLAFAHMEPAA